MTKEKLYPLSLWIFTVLIFVSRLPFLFNDYGSEEDAWGLILTARNINLSGVYEVSRFPGHPLQEYLLSILWDLPSWILNLLTVFVSTTGVFYFMKTIHGIKPESYLPAGVLLAFTPVFYINSTNIMDYTWALSLVLISLYFITKNKLIFAALLLGFACGFRITAGAMVIPFSLLLWHNKADLKNIFKFNIIVVVTALICFIPVINIYGMDFFTYYEYFPYPPFLKNIYKGTIGAWGVIGFIGLCAMLFISILKWGSLSRDEKHKHSIYYIISIVTVVLYLIAFIKIPQKTAFIIPMVPFFILPAAILLSKKQMNACALVMIVSCFVFGVNLNDKLRGNQPTLLAYQTTIGGNDVVIDLLNGPVTADIQKRENKINYAKRIVEAFADVNTKTLVIAGWWQNEINFFALKQPNDMIQFMYYVDEPELRKAKLEGFDIFYLPEQAFYNDLRFEGRFTSDYATEFIFHN